MSTRKEQAERKKRNLTAPAIAVLKQQAIHMGQALLKYMPKIKDKNGLPKAWDSSGRAVPAGL